MRQLVFWGMVLVLLLAPSFTVAQAQEETAVTITGQVVAGTAEGAPLVFPMDVQLVITYQGAITEEYSAQTTADGEFTFADVPRYGEGYAYLVATQYAGLPQISVPLAADELEPIELVVYETSISVNAAQIRVIDGTMIINFDKVDDLGLEIYLDINILNLSDRILYGSESSYTLELPVGAYQVASATEGSSGRFIIQDNQSIPVVHDTAPILPGVPHNIQLIYFLPFKAEAFIHQVFPTDVVNLAIWVPTTAVQLESNYYRRGTETVTVEGVPYFVYEQVAPLTVDENGQANLKFTLGGRPPSGNSTDNGDKGAGENGLLWILMLVMGIIVASLISVGVWWFGRRSIPPLES